MDIERDQAEEIISLLKDIKYILQNKKTDNEFDDDEIKVDDMICEVY